jgi:stress-induced-phosphoprotein 1
MALEAKNKGNQAFQDKNFTEAVHWFSEAIKLDPTNHVLFSNRSGAYAAQGKYKEALEDAEKTIQLKADWGKGYSRKGTALHGLGRFEEAAEVYEKGLTIEPNNVQMKEGLQEVKKELQNQEEGNIGDIFGKAFSGDIFGKIRMNPKLAPFLSQPDYLSMISEIQRNPQNVGKYLQDKRIMATIGALIGINMQSAEDFQMPDEVKEKTSFNEPPKQETKPTPMETEKTPLTAEEKEAEDEKAKGNAAYKEKNFEKAIQHYTKSHELQPTNIVYLTNRAAAYFEAGNYVECIKDCEKAIEEGRSQRADYKQIAKAFTRIGNAYMKMQKYTEAIDAYNHSITEDRTSQTVALLQKATKIKEEEDKRSLLDPVKSQELKEKGNEFFKEKKYPESVAAYTEAISRNPDDYTLYSNRAAAYTNLMQYDLGLKDCDECLSRKPDFVKAYTRKGHILYFMKEYQKALHCYDEGLKYDGNNQELNDGVKRVIAALNENSSKETEKDRLERAMKDPEVQEILSDPVMRQILADMQTNPSAARDHLKNPVIAEKISKLMNAGILRVG